MLLDFGLKMQCENQQAQLINCKKKLLDNTSELIKNFPVKRSFSVNQIQSPTRIIRPGACIAQRTNIKNGEHDLPA